MARSSFPGILDIDRAQNRFYRHTSNSSCSAFFFHLAFSHSLVLRGFHLRMDYGDQRDKKRVSPTRARMTSGEICMIHCSRWPRVAFTKIAISRDIIFSCAPLPGGENSCRECTFGYLLRWCGLMSDFVRGRARVCMCEHVLVWLCVSRHPSNRWTYILELATDTNGGGIVD